MLAALGSIAGAALGGLGGGSSAPAGPVGPSSKANSANFGAVNYRSSDISEGDRDSSATSSAKQNDPDSFAGSAQALAESSKTWLWPVVVGAFVLVASLFLILNRKK